MMIRSVLKLSIHKSRNQAAQEDIHGVRLDGVASS